MDDSYESAPAEGPGVRFGDRRKPARFARLSPRVLEKCSALAAIGTVLVAISVFAAMSVPRAASVAVDLMLAGAAAIVGAMVVATLISLRTPERTDRSTILV